MSRPSQTGLGPILPSGNTGGEDLQGLARSIEDRVSDSLHEVLTQRFVDRRAAVLKAVAGKYNIMSSIKSDGTVIVEGEDAADLFSPRISGGDEEALCWPQHGKPSRRNHHAGEGAGRFP